MTPLRLLTHEGKVFHRPSSNKGRYFLSLRLDKNKRVQLSVSLCARATSAIFNYPPINTEVSFPAPNSGHSCPWGTSNIETRWHIVNNYLYYILGFVTCFDPCLIFLPSVVLRSFTDRSVFCMLPRTAIELQSSYDRALRISPDETRIYSEELRMIGYIVHLLINQW